MNQYILEQNTNLPPWDAECPRFSLTLIFYCKSLARWEKFEMFAPHTRVENLSFCKSNNNNNNRYFSLPSLSKNLRALPESAWFYIQQILHSHNFASNLGQAGQVYEQYCNDEKSFKWNSDKMFHNSWKQEICTT